MGQYPVLYRVEGTASMMKELQDYVAVAVHLALACTLGLNLAIVSAGFARNYAPVGCKACTEGIALNLTSPVQAKAVAALSAKAS